MSESVLLAENRYGKSRVRLVKVERRGSRHDLRELNVDMQLTGDFKAAYVEGDNRLVLPTDTMKNTVYVLAGKQPLGEIEEFGTRLANHFLSRNDQVSRVRIGISEILWQRIECDGHNHDYAFQRATHERRTAMIDHDHSRTSVKSGIVDLVVLKTTASSFKDFIRDEYTTLKDTTDRLFGTAVKAEWSYKKEAASYGELWKSIRKTMLEVFARHDSKGVQHTLYAMGEGILNQFDEVQEIRLSMPNKHCLLVDLTPFGMENPNEVFVPIDEPHGLIEAALKRSGTSESEQTKPLGSPVESSPSAAAPPPRRSRRN